MNGLSEVGRSLWLAGLGALADAERGGRDLFEELVTRGRRVETRQFKALDRAVSRLAENAERVGEEVGERLHAGREQLLHRVQLPTREDLRRLNARIDRLAERLEGLGAPPARAGARGKEPTGARQDGR